MRRSSSRSKASEDFGEHIPQLRRRLRGEHIPPSAVPGNSASSRKPLTGSVPPAPPKLQDGEFEALRRVWRRLDVDGDGVLSPDDLFRAVRKHGLRGVSRRDAYEMLWEDSLQPEPGLSFEQFTASYARIKRDKAGREPRRLYNYIVYSLMDGNLNGTVSADEVYNHFYSFPSDPGVAAGATFLLESMPPGEEEQVSSGLFVRYMQSGALSAVAPPGTFVARPSSAPSGHFLPPPPRMTAEQKFVETTAELKKQLEHAKYKSNDDDAANLSGLDLRHNRDCLSRGITNVRGMQDQKRTAAKRLREKRNMESESVNTEQEERHSEHRNSQSGAQSAEIQLEGTLEIAKGFAKVFAKSQNRSSFSPA